MVHGKGTRDMRRRSCHRVPSGEPAGLSATRVALGCECGWLVRLCQGIVVTTIWRSRIPNSSVRRLVSRALAVADRAQGPPFPLNRLPFRDLSLWFVPNRRDRNLWPYTRIDYESWTEETAFHTGSLLTLRTQYPDLKITGPARKSRHCSIIDRFRSEPQLMRQLNHSFANDLSTR